MNQFALTRWERVKLAGWLIAATVTAGALIFKEVYLEDE